VRDVEAGTGQVSGGLRASAAYLLTGSLAGVNAAIPGYPVFAAQALRYTLATIVLAAACWVQGRRHPLDRGRVRLTRRVAGLLALQATVGVTGFNYCTAEAVRHTGAATVGTVIATVPVVLAIAGPLAARRRPAPRVMAAAMLVAAGAAVTTGLGGPNLPGLLLALGALVAEVSFTLVAVPLLPAFGPLRLAAWVSACSVPVLFGLGFATGGAGAVPAPTASQAAAIVYLAVVVCAGGFYLLYSALPRLGADRVGLFAGLVPFGAMGAALLLNAGTVRPADMAGAVLVAAGVAAGAGTRTRARGASRHGASRHGETERQDEEVTAAAPQLGRTRTGAPRA
jgi:drug/metabolite transporter (DMT)-like permease